MTCMERFHLQQGAIDAVRECAKTLTFLIEDALDQGVSQNELIEPMDSLKRIIKRCS